MVNLDTELTTAEEGWEEKIMMKDKTETLIGTNVTTIIITTTMQEGNNEFLGLRFLTRVQNSYLNR